MRVRAPGSMISMMDGLTPAAQALDVERHERIVVAHKEIPGVVRDAHELLVALHAMTFRGPEAHAFAVHPATWVGLRLAKWADGRYLLDGPGDTLFGVPVAQDQEIPEGVVELRVRPRGR